MTVNYLLNISDYTKCKTEYISGSRTFKNLLGELCDKYGAQFRKTVMNNDFSNLNEEIVVLVNGVSIAVFDGVNTVLQEDDTVTLLPMVMGG